MGPYFSRVGIVCVCAHPAGFGSEQAGRLPCLLVIQVCASLGYTLSLVKYLFPRGGEVEMGERVCTREAGGPDLYTYSLYTYFFS